MMFSILSVSVYFAPIIKFKNVKQNYDERTNIFYSKHFTLHKIK